MGVHMTAKEKRQQREVEKLANSVKDVESALKRVSADERQLYLDAQQSVIDARRKAEADEGFLRIN